MITFPMRPCGGSRFDKIRLFGNYRYEPKIDGWRVLLNTRTRQMWSRHGDRLSIASDFAESLEKMDTSVEWLDCEGLQRRHTHARGTLVVLDAPMLEKTYEERRRIIESEIPTMKLGSIPEPNSFCLVNSVSDGDMLWKLLEGKPMYEGIVAKKLRSYYPLQTVSPTRESKEWIKFRYK